MWKDHRCYSYTLNGAFCSESELVLHFIGVYIINRTLHGHLGIRNFPSRVGKYLNLQHSKINFVSPAHPYDILYVSTFETHLGEPL